nr:maf-like protein DDB_G0281937 isoform X4 [Ipomoea batatas]
MKEILGPTLLITADTISKAMTYMHLMISRWRFMKESSEKSHQARKKRACSSKVC